MLIKQWRTVRVPEVPVTNYNNTAPLSPKLDYDYIDEHELRLYDFGVYLSDEDWKYEYTSIQYIVNGEVINEQCYPSREEALDNIPFKEREL